MAVYLALDQAPEYYVDEEVSSSPQVHISPGSVDLQRFTMNAEQASFPLNLYL